MLKKETLQKIAALAKIKEEDLTAAITNEAEVDLAIPEGLTTLTTQDLESRDTNVKNEGIKVGKEIGVKEVRKAAGLEEGAPKDPKDLAEAIMSKAVKDAKIAPDEKVTQLTEQVNLLKKQVGEKDAEIDLAKQSASQASLDAKILTNFPKNRLSTLTDSEYLTLIKSTVSVKDVDGKLVVEKDGVILRDPTKQDPLPLDKAIGTIFSDRKWIEEEKPAGGGGRGGGNSGAGAATYASKSEMIKAYQEAGKSINGQEFIQELQSVIKDNPDFKSEE
jgi:hypothetical protein